MRIRAGVFAVHAPIVGAVLLLAPSAPLGAQAAPPATAPAAERIVYSSYRPAGWDIQLVRRGGTTEQLTDDPALDYDAVVSSNGRWVVFTSERDGSPDLYALDLQRRGPARRLLRSDAMEDQAALSPDGRWLVFVGTAGGDADVYRLPFRPDTTLAMGDAVNLTHRPGADLRPAISPDGRRIAFTSDHDTPPATHPQFPFAVRRDGELYVMNADGGDLRRLTRSPGWDGSPAWGPDGRTLYFYSERGQPGRFRIWALDLATDSARPVSQADVPALSPAVAGDRLAFTVVSDPQGPPARVVSVPLAGGAPRDESPAGMDCFAPAYLPDGDAFVCHGGPRPAASLADFPGPLIVAGSPQLRALDDRTVALTGVRSAFASPPHPTRDELALRPSPTGVTLLAADGTAPSRLLDLQGTVPLAPGDQLFNLRWSPDGQWLAFTLGPFAGGAAAQADIWKVRADGSGLVNLTPRSRGNDGFAEFSPDGTPDPVPQRTRRHPGPVPDGCRRRQRAAADERRRQRGLPGLLPHRTADRVRLRS